MADTCVEAPEKVEIKRILCPADFSAESENALKFASDLARRFDAELSVVQVLSRSEDAKNSPELCDWVPVGYREKCNLREVVKRGDFVEQILNYSRDAKTDLIVIGATHRIFSDETLGEKTLEIVRTATCPVITVSNDFEFEFEG